MKNKMIILSSVFAGGILFASKVNIQAVLWSFVLALFISIAIITVKGKKAIPVILLIVCFLAGAADYSFFCRTENKAPAKYAGKYVTLTGKVCADPDLGDGTTDGYTIKLSRLDYNKNSMEMNDKISLRLIKSPDNITFKYGDVVSVSGFLRTLDEPKNSLGADYSIYWESHGVHFYMYTQSYNCVKTGENINILNPYDASHILREKIRGPVDKYFEGIDAGLLKGIMISDKSGIDGEAEELLRTSGLSHIVVASGMHMGIILGLCMWLFLALRIKKRYALLLCIPVICAFSFLCMLGASVIRAALMAILFIIAELLSKDDNRLTSLFSSAFVMMLANPAVIFDIGFLLSFFSVLGILVFMQPIYMFLVKYIKLKYISASVAATVGVHICIMPILIYYFNSFPPYAILSAILTAFCVPYILIGGYITVILSYVFTPVANLAAGFVYIWLTYLKLVMKFISVLPFSRLLLKSPHMLSIVFYILAVIILYRLIYRKSAFKTYALASACLGIACAFAISSFINMDTLKISAINVGEGDSILIQTPLGQNILVDGGGSSVYSDYSIGENIVIPYLISHGANRLDYVILSHYDKDHADGVVSVLENMDAGALLLPKTGDGYENEYKNKIETLAKARDILVYYLSEGDSFDFENGLMLDVLNPADETAVSDNDSSLVFRLTYGDVSALFCGDISKTAERLILKSGAYLDSDILKVAHHGSDTSSTVEFLDAVTPEYAIISVGGNNTFSHPSKDVLERLEDAGSEIYRTDKSGDVVFYISKDKIKKIYTFK